MGVYFYDEGGGREVRKQGVQQVGVISEEKEAVALVVLVSIRVESCVGGAVVW
jgi:hypothetical protein